ncbi:MAG: excisionase family DNA-binding protein [Frankiaceae bacterium]
MPLGSGRTKVYELIRSGRLNSVKIGMLRRIPTAPLYEFVALKQEDELSAR